MTEQEAKDATFERRPHAGGRSKVAHLCLAVLLVAIIAAGVGAWVVVGAGSAARRVSAEGAPERPVTAMDQGAGLASNSPKLLADPTEARFVVLANRFDAPDFGCALQVSDDEGAHWLPVQPVTALPSGVDKCYAPEVAFDGKGTLFYLFVGLAGGGNEPVGAFLATSGDRGRTFSPPRQVLGPLNFAVRMAIDRSGGGADRLHLVWLHAGADPPLGGFAPVPNPVMAAYSDDGGGSFSDPVVVSDAGRDLAVAPALALDDKGGVHVAYYDLVEDARDYRGLAGPVWEGTWSVVLATSTDRGERFGPGIVVDDEVRPWERVLLIFTMPPPSLVADGNRVCAAWSDARHGDADAVVSCSTDRGRTWGGVARLNDDAPSSGPVQYLPILGLGASGRLDAAFYDRRADPRNVRNDVSYTFSMDGGRTFAPNLRLSSNSFDARIGQQYLGAAAEGKVEFGSRMALLASSSHVVVAWTDTRNSEPGTTGQDIFASAVRLTENGGTSWPRVAGVGVAAVGTLILSVVLVARRRRRPEG